MRKLELEQIPFSIRDHLADLLKPLALRAEQKDLEVVCHVLPDVPERRGRRSRDACARCS